MLSNFREKYSVSICTDVSIRSVNDMKLDVNEGGCINEFLSVERPLHRKDDNETHRGCPPNLGTYKKIGRLLTHEIVRNHVLDERCILISYGNIEVTSQNQVKTTTLISDPLNIFVYMGFK